MKTPNPLLKKLGFADTDRVVIIHADDVGMCQATLPALADLFDFGLVSSAATMVPCAWFSSLAKYCREHPQADVGVHTTLNCEWTAYRWGALSTTDPASGLLDNEGYLHQWPPATYEHATAEAVQAELQTQVQRALAPDWESRVANYRLFISEKMRDFIHNSGIQVIGYRALRDVLRSI